jgi:photosystem II stability/assembly factor-like uncharacterized protein
MNRRIGALAALRRATAPIWILVAAWALPPGTSRANGRFPAANMLVARPGDPSRLLVRATYGLLLSSDAGRTWDWLCERAVGYGGSEDPSVVIAANGALLVGMFDGLARSTDGGCTWQRDPSEPRGVVDLTLRASVPDRVYAVTSLFSRVGDAGVSRFHSELLVSADAGAHWSARATLDPSLIVDSVEVAPSDPERVYVSAVRRGEREIQGVLLVSDDDGAHFVERPFELSRSDRGVYVGAVAPQRADRVYVRVDAGDAGRIRVTDDAGATWVTPFQGGPVLGFALSADGDAIYTGGPRDGLLAAGADDLRFAARSKLPVQCLTSIGAALWACAPAGGGFVLGASSTRGVTFEPRLTLRGMRGPLGCAPPSAVDQCAEDWDSLRRLVGVDDATGATAETAPSSAGAHRSACHCSTPGRGGGGQGGAGGVAALTGAVVLFALALRRRGVRT